MCSHYQGMKETSRLEKYFGVRAPAAPVRDDVWPGYAAAFIRRGVPAGDGTAASLECMDGLFGLVPHWATDTKLSRSTYNARSETVAEKPAFRDAWHKGQHCIIPVEALYEPDWRSGKAVPARIQRADGTPMGVAGLWARWRTPKGEWVHSFTMLTINADTHPLMRQFHKPADEKRMVVVLPPQKWQAWLQAPAANSMEFLQPLEAQELTAVSAPPPGVPVTASLLD